MADRSETPVVPMSQASNVLTTKIDPTSARFEANMRFLADLMSQVRNEGEKICKAVAPRPSKISTPKDASPHANASNC